MQQAKFSLTLTLSPAPLGSHQEWENHHLYQIVIWGTISLVIGCSLLVWVGLFKIGLNAPTALGLLALYLSQFY